MVAAIPLTVCTARNSPPTGARFAGLRSHSSSSWLQALRCSRLSARNNSAYCERSMESAEDALHGLEHARWLERLHDEILRAGLDRLDARRPAPASDRCPAAPAGLPTPPQPPRRGPPLRRP